MLNVLNPIAQFLDENGNPISLGKVVFFEAGTDNRKNVYRDYAKTDPISETILDAGGMFQVPLFYGSGFYKIKVYKYVHPNFVDFKTVDNVEGDGIVSPIDPTDLKVRFVDDVQRLSTLNAVALDIDYAYCYAHNGDSLGGGWFFWDAASVAPEDNGTIFKYASQGTGRWIRVFASEVAYPQMFGVNTNQNVPHTALLQSMVNFCILNPKYRIVFPAGSYHLDSNLLIPNGIQCAINSGAVFNNLSTTSITFTLGDGTEIEGYERAFLKTNPMVVSINGTIRPEWWGAVGDDSADDSQAFKWMSEHAGANNDVEISKVYAFNQASAPFQSALFPNARFIQTNSGMLHFKTEFFGMQFNGLIAKKQAVKIETAAQNLTLKIGGDVKSSWILNDTIPSFAQLQKSLDIVTFDTKSRLLIDSDMSFAAGSYTSASSEIDILEGVKITLSGNVSFDCPVNIPSAMRIITNGYSWSNFPATAQFRWFADSDKAVEFCAKSNCALTANGNYTSPPTYIATGSTNLLTIRDVIFSLPVGDLVFGINHGGLLHLDNVVTINGSANSTIKITAIGGKMNSCKFYDSGGVQVDFGGAYARIDSCSFNGGATTTLINPSSLCAYECFFAQDVSLQGSSAGYVCIGTSIKKNLLGASKNILAGANLASLGHKADVYENATTSGSYVNSTKNTTQIQYTVAQNSVLVKSPDPTSSFYDAAVASKKFLPYQNAPLYASVEVARWSSAFTASDAALICYYGMNDNETLKKAFFISNAKTTSGFTTHFNFTCTWSSVSGDEF